ncbi:hypothetical protein [Pseudotabrizicola sediminis]|nr:hypothetical protein [Pseudotabrizicola sediminis]
MQLKKNSDIVGILNYTTALFIILIGYMVQIGTANADDSRLDRFTETFSQRCLFDDKIEYSSIDQIMNLPFFQRSTSKEIPEVIFSDRSSWNITKFASSETFIVKCLFSADFSITEINRRFSSIAGTVDTVPPFMDKPSGQNIVTLTEGDGTTEPRFFAIVSLLSASEGTFSRTYGTVSFLPLALFH